MVYPTVRYWPGLYWFESDGYVTAGTCVDQYTWPVRSISSTQLPLISVTRKWPFASGKTPLGLPNPAGGLCAHVPSFPRVHSGAGEDGDRSTSRQFLMSAAITVPSGSIIASSGFHSWFGPDPCVPGVPYRQTILRVAMSISVMTNWSSSVAMICLPSRLKKTSSGIRKVWPAARSPGCGHCHSTWPWGLTTTRRLFFLSAMMIGPGRTLGSEPGARAPGSPGTAAGGHTGDGDGDGLGVGVADGDGAGLTPPVAVDDSRATGAGAAAVQAVRDSANAEAATALMRPRAFRARSDRVDLRAAPLIRFTSTSAR